MSEIIDAVFGFSVVLFVVTTVLNILNHQRKKQKKKYGDSEIHT